MPESPADAYARGRADGEISVRLDHHDEDLVALNITLAKVVSVEAELSLAVQELALVVKASRETAEALALALKDAKETAEAADRAEVAKAATAQRAAAEKDALGWSPVTKVFAVATALFGLIATAALLLR